MDTLKTLSIDQIDESPTNPRKHFDEAELAELADSIREQGLIQPITVRRYHTSETSPELDRYELVVGARRRRACQIAGLTDIPAIVRELSDEQVVEVQLIENDQRSGVTPLEEAAAIVYLSTKFERSPEYIADRIGRTTDYCRRRMKLSTLIGPMQKLLIDGRIGLGSAELLGECPEALQHDLAVGSLAIDAVHYSGQPQSWSRQQVEGLIRNAMRYLRVAWWDLSDEGLGAPPCITCPKRSSCQPDLLAACGIGTEAVEESDQCTDGSCWEAKEEAYLERLTDAGATILEGDEAQKAVDRWGRSKQYLPVDYKPNYSGPTLADMAAGEVPVTYAHHRHGLDEVYEMEVFYNVLRERGDDDLVDTLTGKKDKEASKLKRAADAAEREARREQMNEVVRSFVDDMAAGRTGTQVCILTECAIGELNRDVLEEVVTRRDIEAEKLDWGGKDYAGALRSYSRGLTSTQRWGLLVELLVTRASIGYRRERWAGVLEDAGVIEKAVLLTMPACPASSRTVNALAESGITNTREVAEYVSADSVDAAIAQLTNLPGVGKSGAADVMTFLVERGWTPTATEAGE